VNRLALNRETALRVSKDFMKPFYDVVVTRHGKKPEVKRFTSRGAMRAFLKPLRGKREHHEFSEVCVEKVTHRYRFDPAPGAPAEKQKQPEPSRLNKFVANVKKAFTPEPKPEQITEAPSPGEHTEAKSKKAKATKPKASGAFAARVAAAKPAETVQPS